MKHFFWSTLVLLAVVLTFTACEKDDPEEPNEEEVITSLIYTLNPGDGSIPVVISFQDLDGDGGNAPTIVNGTLQANTTYSGAIELLNEQETPAERITEEIEEEDEEHQFFFETSVNGLTVAYDDKDEDGNPIGLATTLTTGEAGSGTLTVTLRHEPDKAAAGVADGMIANAGGETDIEVSFDIEVQ